VRAEVAQGRAEPARGRSALQEGARELHGEERPWVRPVVLGAGDPLVVLPTAQGDWRCLAPAFLPLADRRRVVLVSLRGERGHGVAADFGWDDLVADLDEAARLAGLGRFALCGTSFGGALALRYALDRPDRVERLVLNVATARLRDHARLNAIAGRLPVGPRAALFHALALALCSLEVAALPPAELPSALRRLAGHVPFRTPGPTLMRRLELLLGLDVEGRLAGLRCPTLVVSGEPRLDRLVPRRSQAALLERLPDVRHAVVPRSGHLGLLTRPDALRRVVASFLDGPEGDPAGERGPSVYSRAGS
jgi:pimeloyl-ACP methyl ester carboxylesterase